MHKLLLKREGENYKKTKKEKGSKIMNSGWSILVFSASVKIFICTKWIRHFWTIVLYLDNGRLVGELEMNICILLAYTRKIRNKGSIVDMEFWELYSWYMLSSLASSIQQISSSVDQIWTWFEQRIRITIIINASENHCPYNNDVSSQIDFVQPFCDGILYKSLLWNLISLGVSFMAPAKTGKKLGKKFMIDFIKEVFLLEFRQVVLPLSSVNPPKVGCLRQGWLFCEAFQDGGQGAYNLGCTPLDSSKKKTCSTACTLMHSDCAQTSKYVKRGKIEYRCSVAGRIIPCWKQYTDLPAAVAVTVVFGADAAAAMEVQAAATVNVQAAAEVHWNGWLCVGWEKVAGQHQNMVWQIGGGMGVELGGEIDNYTTNNVS
ncbi:hypothetical protein VP01_3127g1 [Puccinia sorghi]|uniref:Uncharacterized protein n=1 Tax=Puccinia sorghi TaxID=27349 RepID=A0A0L6UZZ1_9BASI|nr:hypothetical protein VP01_3127g1 [Puccinia sorghi]